MEGGDNILEAIYEEDDLEDVEMLDIEGEHVNVEEGECVDVEEGELVKENSHSGLEQISGLGVNIVNQDMSRKNRRRRPNKKKNKRRTSDSVLKVTDINRFYFAKDSHVLFVCSVLVLYSLFTINYL